MKLYKVPNDPMTKTKLKIMELLGDDLVDRSQRIGCLIKEEKTLKPVVFINEFDVENNEQQDDVNYFDGQEIKTTNSRWLIKDNILGQYHLGTILRWLDNKTLIRGHLDGGLYIGKDGKTDIKLDTTKPPMEWDEEQDKLLLDFMEKVGRIK